MDIRIVSYFVIIFGAVFIDMIGSNYKGFDKRKFYIIIVCFMLAIQSGLRNLEVGPDTNNYYNIFIDIKSIRWYEIFNNFIQSYIYGTARDPGYPLLVKILQLFNSDFQVFLVLVATFYFISIGLFIYKNTSKLRDVVFAFSLYVALFQIIGLSGIRQQIATAIALFAYQYIKTKKHLKFFILVLLGSTIHISLLIVILFWAISLLPIKYVRILYFIPLLILPIIFQFGRSLILLMSDFLANDYYAAYAELKDTGSPWSYIVLSILVYLIGLVLINKTIIRNKVNKIYFVAIGLMIFFVPLITINGALIRIGQFYSLYLMIFIPLLINYLRIKRSEKLAVFFALILGLIFLSIRNPFVYYFFWQTI